MSTSSSHVPNNDSTPFDPEEVEADFLYAYFRAYGSGDTAVHGAPSTRRRLAQKRVEVTSALDFGIVLAIIEPEDGSSYFNVGLLLLDLGMREAAIFAFLGAVRLLDIDDPDRLLAVERATALAEKCGFTRAAEALTRGHLPREIGS